MLPLGSRAQFWLARDDECLTENLIGLHYLAFTILMGKCVVETRLIVLSS